MVAHVLCDILKRRAALTAASTAALLISCGDSASETTVAETSTTDAVETEGSSAGGETSAGPDASSSATSSSATGETDDASETEETEVTEGPAPSVENLLFQSGFEAEVSVVEIDTDFGDLVGLDSSVEQLGDWELDLEDGAPFGEFRFYFEGGTSDEREVRVIPDPDDPQNRALEFALRAPNVLVEDDDAVLCNGVGVTEDRKGRIQAVLRGNVDVRHIDYRVRLRLDDGFALIEQSGVKITWMTLAEFWNNLANQEFPFRVTLNLHKDDAAPNTPLSWHLHGQTRDGGAWNDVWTHAAGDVPVPLGSWMELHVELTEGDASSGHVRVELTTDEPATYEIIDRAVATYHPDDPAPDGFTDFNPLKLYTSGPVLCGLLDAGSELIVRWDDFKIGAAGS